MQVAMENENMYKSEFERVLRATNKDEIDLGEILNCKNIDDENEVKRAYKRIVLRIHPDKFPSYFFNIHEDYKDCFTICNKVYGILIDKTLRFKYDFITKVCGKNPKDVLFGNIDELYNEACLFGSYLDPTCQKSDKVDPNIYAAIWIIIIVFFFTILYIYKKRKKLRQRNQ